MTKTLNDIKMSFSDMSIEEAKEFISSIRSRKFNHVKKTQRKKSPSQTSKKSNVSKTKSLISSMSPEQKQLLLKQLNGE